MKIRINDNICNHVLFQFIFTLYCTCTLHYTIRTKTDYNLNNNFLIFTTVLTKVATSRKNTRATGRSLPTSDLTLSVVRVERSMSKTARRTSKGQKIGTWCICDDPKARPEGPSPHLGCVFVQRRRKRRVARPKGPSWCFGCGSFVEERRSSGEARRADPVFIVASDQKCQILALVVSPWGVSKGTNRSHCCRLSYFEP